MSGPSNCGDAILLPIPPRRPSRFAKRLMMGPGLGGPSGARSGAPRSRLAQHQRQLAALAVAAMMRVRVGDRLQ
eukprot:8616429-Pyramimonas_sp.AAC.1